MIRIKPIFYLLLTLPAIIFLLLPTLHYQLGLKLWKKLAIHSGYCTLSLFTLSLILTPLTKHFPKFPLFKALNRHRRAVGITVFLYASFHFASVLIKTILKKGELPSDYFLHPVVLPALLAFLILFLLTLTSNDASIRRLGYARWKGIHQLVYCAELLVFSHVLQKSPVTAFSFFIPLLLIQRIRINNGVL